MGNSEKFPVICHAEIEVMTEYCIFFPAPYELFYGALFFNKEEDTMTKYVEELIRIIRSNLSKEELADRLSDYHDNDIAESLESLTEQERKNCMRHLAWNAWQRYLRM